MSKTSAGCGFASSESAKADLYQEASTFCSTSGKEAEILSSGGRNGIPLVRCAHAEIKFSCLDSVPEGSPEFNERRRRQEARILREAEAQ